MRFKKLTRGVQGILLAALLVPGGAVALSYAPISGPVVDKYKSFYNAKRKLLSKLKKDGALSGPEYFTLGIACQVDDTPDSIILSMTAAAKCGANVTDYFIASGISGTPEGFYEASKKLSDPGLALGQGLLAVTFAPKGSEFETLAREHLSGLKGAFEAAGGNEVYLNDTLKTIEGRIEQLIAAGAYSDAPGRDVLSPDQIAKVEVSSAFSASNEGPFGLSFGMLRNEIPLQAIESDKYGKDSFNAANTHYSCAKEMHYILGGDYMFSNRRITMDDPNIQVRGGWINALGQGGEFAASLAQDFYSWHEGGLQERTFQDRYWLSNDFRVNQNFKDYDVGTYVSDSGTRLCLGFYKNQLVRLKANLSAKRDLIPGLRDKLNRDYSGSLAAKNEYRRSTGMELVITYRWSGPPQGTWVTLQYQEYKPPSNADFSKAYSYGATYTPPKSQHMQAYVDYTYMPLFSDMLDGYTRWVKTSQQNITEKKTEQKNKALSEF